MDAMDVYVKLSASQGQSQPDFAETAAFFNGRLSRFEKAKYHQLPTYSKDTFEFLVRINKCTIKSLKQTVKRSLPGFDTVIIKECDSNLTRLLDTSCSMQIAVLTAIQNAPPVITGAVASGAPAPSQSLPDSGHQCLAQSDAGSKSQGCARENKPSSDDAGITTNRIKSIFSKQAGGAYANEAFSSAKIVFALQLSDCYAPENLTELKRDLTREIQAKTYQAVIDVATTTGKQLLKVNMACEWKNPMYTRAMRRTIESAVRNRFRIVSVRFFQIDPSAISNSYHTGSRWLQHSLPKGAAYTMCMEDFIKAIGNEVKVQEALFLNCETLAQFREDAKAKQVLLCNLHDVLRWRFRPAVQQQSSFIFRDPALGGQSLEVHSVAGHASISGRALEAPSLDSPPDPAVAPRESSVSSSVAGDLSAPTPSASSSKCRNRALVFSGDSVVHTPSGGARPACDTGVGPAGMFHTM